MYKQIIAINIILICLFCISGCDTSEAVELDDTDNFSIIKDIEYKEPIELISQNNNKIIKEKTKIEDKQTTTLTPPIEETIEPVFEESAPTESVSKEPQFQSIEEDKTEIILQENFDEDDSSNNYNNNTSIYIDNDVNTNGLTQEAGINFYNGRTETYYSSNILYHQDTDKWVVDDEGFYRTDEGYYVVAASDKEQGTVFEGSKGTCIVLDSGCEDGIDDYYVNW